MKTHQLFRAAEIGYEAAKTALPSSGFLNGKSSSSSTGNFASLDLLSQCDYVDMLIARMNNPSADFETMVSIWSTEKLGPFWFGDRTIKGYCTDLIEAARLFLHNLDYLIPQLKAL